MKTLTLLLVSAFALAAQTVTATLSIQIPAAVQQDINTYWASQSTPIGALVADMASADTAIQLSQRQDGIKAGDILIIGSDLRAVVSVSAATVTVAPVTLAGFASSNHATGDKVAVLKFATPFAMVAEQALRPWMQGIISQLGARSATLGGSVTGSVQ
jgi:hypothetical protein